MNNKILFMLSDWALKRVSVFNAVIISTLFLSVSAFSATWPVQPVRLVVPVGPGSTGDTMVRMLAPRLESMWKQPVIVENKPGAGSIVGTEYVINAKDGHTILLGTLSSLLPKYTTTNLRYDPAVDLIPIYKIINYETVLFVSEKTGTRVNTIEDFIEESKNSSDGVFFAGLGPTSIFNMMMRTINNDIGIRYSSVDFNSVAEMNMALMRDDAQFALNAPSNVKAHIESGKFKPILAIAPKRYKNLPNLPTVAEAVGYDGYMPISWAGLFGPKNMSQNTVEVIARDINSVLSDPAFRRDLEQRLGGEILDSSPQIFAKEYAEDLTAWERVVKNLNITPQ